MSDAMEMPKIPVTFDVTTREAEKLIREFMTMSSRAGKKGDAQGAADYRGWAFGVYMLWQSAAPKEIAIPRNNALWLLVVPDDAEDAQ